MIRASNSPFSVCLTSASPRVAPVLPNLPPQASARVRLAYPPSVSRLKRLGLAGLPRSLVESRGVVVSSSLAAYQGVHMSAAPTVLKLLLSQRHMQRHQTFAREYAKAARSVGTDQPPPSKAQFYRWLSGELIRLPHPDHCLVLEKLLPGWTVEQLLQPHEGDLSNLPEPRAARQSTAMQHPPMPSPVALPSVASLLDITAAYATRSAFLHNMPLGSIFDRASQIDIVGLSLNMICQQYSDRKLLDLLNEGTAVRALFLDPDGESIRVREREEGQPDGHLVTLTRLNIDVLRRIRSKIRSDGTERLQIRTYDEPPRFNITITDNEQCIVQPYLPDARGVESPTFVMERQGGDAGLFETFSQVFTAMWERATEVM